MRGLENSHLIGRRLKFWQRGDFNCEQGQKGAYTTARINYKKWKILNEERSSSEWPAKMTFYAYAHTV